MIFTPENLLLIGSLVVELLASLTGLLLFLINRKKKQLEQDSTRKDINLLKEKAAKTQIDLEGLICMSAFTHCPKCGEKLYYRDLDFEFMEEKK